MAHRHHVELEQPVLKSIARRLETAYVVMLDGLTERMAGVLKRARGDVSKSERFFIGDYVGKPVGGDDLLKAVRPKSAKAKSAAPKKAKAGDAKKWHGKAKGPGSHGATKWWRDEKGHVHYGEKPPEREGKWKQLDEGDVSKLHTRLNVVFGYSDEVTKWAEDHLQKQGVGVNLRTILAEADNFGMSLDEYVKMTAQGADAKKISKAIQNTVKAYEGLLKNKEFLASAKSAVIRKRHSDSVVVQKALRTKEYSEGHLDKLLDAKEGSLRMSALIADMELLEVPESITEARLDFTDDDEAAAQIGFVRVNQDNVRLFHKRLGELSEEQLVALWVARRIEDTQSGAASLGKKGDTTRLGTDDKAGRKANKKKFEAGQQFNELLNQAALDAIGGSEKKALLKLNELAAGVHKKLTEMNDGGSEMEMVMTGEVSPRDLFANKDAAKKLKARHEEKKLRVQRMIDAQEGKNGIPATPSAIKKALGNELFEYQRKFLGWMLAAKRGVLAAGAGTGKTPTSIAFVAMLKDLAAKGKMDKRDARGLLILPPSVVEQWPGEIAKFYPDAKVVVIGDDVDGVEDRVTLLEAINNGSVEADFVIMSSSVLNPTRETQEAFKRSKVFDYNEETNEAVPKKGVDPSLVRDELRNHMKNDRLTQALRSLRGCSFFDEAHSAAQGLKSDTNTHNAIARELMHGREHGFLLTATPTPNGDANELHNLVDCVSPGALGSKKFFAGRFNALLKDVKPRKSKNEDPEMAAGKREVASAQTQHNRYVAAAPYSRLLSAYVYRKDKQDKDVVESAKKARMSVLPNINIAHHHLKPTATESRIYAECGNIEPHYWGSEEHRKEMGDKYEDFKPASEAENALAKEGKKRAQLDAASISPQILLGDGTTDASKKLWKKYGYKGEETKVDHFVNMVGEHFSDPANINKPIVIFCDQPRAFARCRARLAKDLGIHPSLTAEISGNVADRGDRNAMQEAINAAKQKVIFVGTQAGGAGLNLQKASHTVIDLNTPWTAADKEQTQGRVWRTGQTHDVDSHVFSIAGSGDYGRLAKIKEKNERDILMAYVKDGNPDVVEKITKAKNYLLAAEGAKDVHHEAGIAKKTWKLPKELRQKFDAVEFRKTVDFDRYLKFEDQKISSRRATAQANHAKGKLSKAQYEKTVKKLDAEQKTWGRYKAVLGKQPVMVEKGAQAFTAKAPTKDVLKKLSPTSKAVLAAMKEHKTGLTKEGFVRHHLRGEVDKTLSKMTEKNRTEAVRQHAAKNDLLEKETERAFKELEKHGLLAKTKARKK